MEKENVLAASFKLLGRNPLVWFFTVLLALGDVLGLPGDRAPILACILTPVAIYLWLICPLCAVLVLYRSYLDQTVGLRATWREARHYLIRWLGLLLLGMVLWILPFMGILRAARQLPFLYSQVLLTLPATGVVMFLSVHLVLAMLTTKPGLLGTAKLAVQAWFRDWPVKLAFALTYSVVTIAFYSLPLVVESGLTSQVVLTPYVKYAAAANEPLWKLLDAAYAAATTPVIYALITVLHMRRVPAQPLPLESGVPLP